MEKLDSLTPDLTQENIDRIAALFPECVTEAENESGGVPIVLSSRSR